MALLRYLEGGFFGPKKNNVTQAAATSAGSLWSLFTSGFMAAYQLGLLQASPSHDIGHLFTFMICCAFFGLAFSIPLCKFYILKLKLILLTGVPAAYTIQSLHVGKNVVVEASKTTKVLILSLCFAITLWVLQQRAGNGYGALAFIGVRMLTGINASHSFLSGSFLAWSIIGPLIVSRGMASGFPANNSIPSYMNYFSIQDTFQPNQ
ncbi:hypothetical protein J3R83DRAFT_3383 [Lanmaoa asiatica]|nr:hypothetical protein J3R83DRAFT_3383 [Lanmaoa asiatica]